MSLCPNIDGQVHESKVTESDDVWNGIFQHQNEHITEFY
jgi:hypothetical protein